MEYLRGSYQAVRVYCPWAATPTQIYNEIVGNAIMSADASGKNFAEVTAVGNRASVYASKLTGIDRKLLTDRKTQSIPPSGREAHILRVRAAFEQFLTIVAAIADVIGVITLGAAFCGAAWAKDLIIPAAIAVIASSLYLLSEPQEDLNTVLLSVLNKQMQKA